MSEDLFCPHCERNVTCRSCESNEKRIAELVEALLTIEKQSLDCFQCSAHEYAKEALKKEAGR